METTRIEVIAIFCRLPPNRRRFLLALARDLVEPDGPAPVREPGIAQGEIDPRPWHRSDP